jgi:hypothetical protein
VSLGDVSLGDVSLGEIRDEFIIAKFPINQIHPKLI